MSSFSPQLSLISGINNAQQAVVTFASTHDFLTNSYISLRVSKSYGMVEMNNKRGKVLSTTSNTATLDIDSTNFNTFVTPVTLRGTTPPCAVPAGSGVDFSSIVPRTILEDAFDNVPN